MLSAPYDRLRVGNSRGSAGPDARRAGSVTSFADVDGVKEVEAPIRSSTTGSGAISIVRRPRTQSSHFFLCGSLLTDLFSLSHIPFLPSLLSFIALSRTIIVRTGQTNSRATQPRKQPLLTSSHDCGANALCNATHHAETLSRNQGDNSARVCEAWWAAAAARGARPRQDRREQDKPHLGLPSPSRFSQVVFGGSRGCGARLEWDRRKLRDGDQHGAAEQCRDAVSSSIFVIYAKYE